MPIEHSNRVLLITENTRIAAPIRQALTGLGMIIESEFLNLHSIPSIQKGIARSGRTAFIRTELLRFIRERGFPRAIIMDARIDLGIGPGEDPGNIKLLKTFLIAYIIISKGRDTGNIHGRFILLARGKEFEKEYGLGSGPVRILDLLATQNPDINFFIEELKENRARFDQLFTIRMLDPEIPAGAMKEIITGLLNAAKAKDESAAAPPETTGPDAGADTVDADKKGAPAETPARVLYRLDENTVYDDGEFPTELSEEHRALKEKEFYLAGSWTSTTELEVALKIAGVLQKGLGDKKRFSYNDAIVFNIDEKCAIDKNTTLSMAQLFTKNLSAFKKIAVKVSPGHGKVIEKSRGYPMVKNIVSVAKGDDPPAGTEP